MKLGTKRYLGDHVDNIVLGANLHRDWEIGSGISREKELNGTLLESLVAYGTTNLQDVQLKSCPELN